MDSKNLSVTDYSPQIVAVGDCLVLMNPNKTGSLRYVRSFETEWAGAEANFLVGCARLGLETGFLSAFSCDPFGKMIYHSLKGEQVDLLQIQWDSERSTPLFFKERHPNGDFCVYYYRSNTAGVFVDLQLIQQNYFALTKIFFFTGIFPALSKANEEFLHNLLPTLKKQGVSICFDPNIRLKLFQNTKQVKKLILPFLQFVDLLLISHNEAEILFDTQEPKKVFEQAAKYAIDQAVLKMGKNGASGWDGKNIFTQKAIPTTVLDTCGAGDAFNAGFVYGYLKNLPFADTLDLAAYVASFAVSSYSDNENYPSLKELFDARKNKKSITR